MRNARSRIKFRVASPSTQFSICFCLCRERKQHRFGGAGVVEVEEAARRGGDAEVLREGAEVCEHESEAEGDPAAALE